MNKIHRIIFNQALGLNQVVSEIAGSHFKVASCTKPAPKKEGHGIKLSLMSLAITLSFGIASSPLFAADIIVNADIIGADGGVDADGDNAVNLNQGDNLTINLNKSVTGGNGGTIISAFDTSGGAGVYASTSGSGDNSIINNGHITGGNGTYGGNGVQGSNRLILTNSGSIAGGLFSKYKRLTGSDGVVFAGGTDNIINNSGSITGKNGIKNQSGSGTTITNTGGTITGTVDAGIWSYGGTIDLINNTGTITGATYGINNNNMITIVLINNTGTITGASYGINNDSGGTIETFYNNQGNAGNISVPLTFNGILPHNYGVILGSDASTYGQLTVTNARNWDKDLGLTNFSIHSGSVKSTIYPAVISGVSASLLNSSTLTGNYSGYSYSLVEEIGTTDIWDLLFPTYVPVASGPNAPDTQESLHNSAQRLRSTFNASAVSTNFANMNAYDCNLFDTKGMCISAGGRYATVDNPNSNSTSAVVVVGYKATPNIRIGGFLDQNVSNNTPTGIKVSNKNPLMGIFAVWNQNADGLGVQVKVANAYQDKDVNTTRDVIGTSEAGTGATNLNTQSYVGELSYAFRTNQDKTTLRPYLALRQTTIKQDAYTETGVSTPLAYAALKDRSTTALVGLKLNHALTPKATLTASFGIEHDLEHSVDQYSATSSNISGLTPENFNDSIKHTRLVASAGAYYAVSKTQRISGDVFYQQLPFQSTGSTTAYFSYMIGL